MTSSAASPYGRLATFAIVSFDRHPDTSAGIGRRVTDRIRAFGMNNVQVTAVDALTPELSGQLAGADYAIFIDSPRAGNHVNVKVRSLEACGSELAGSSIPASGHDWDPCSLLALTYSAYGHCPQAWLVQVYLPKTESLLPATLDEALEQALAQVENLLRQSQR